MTFWPIAIAALGAMLSLLGIAYYAGRIEGRMTSALAGIRELMAIQLNTIQTQIALRHEGNVERFARMEQRSEQIEHRLASIEQAVWAGDRREKAREARENPR